MNIFQLNNSQNENNLNNHNLIENSLEKKINHCYSIIDKLLLYKDLLDNQCFFNRKYDFSIINFQTLYPPKIYSGNDNINEYDDKVFKFKNQISFIELPSSDEENSLETKKKTKPKFKEICDHYCDIRLKDEKQDKNTLNYPGVIIQNIPKLMKVEDLRRQVKTFFEPVELRIINVGQVKLAFCKFENIKQCDIFYQQFQRYGQKSYAYDNFDNNGDVYYVVVRNIPNYIKNNFEEKYLKNYEGKYTFNKGHQSIERLGGINCWVIAFEDFDSAFKFCKEFNNKDGLKVHFHYKCLQKNTTNINTFKNALFKKGKGKRRKNVQNLNNNP